MHEHTISMRMRKKNTERISLVIHPSYTEFEYMHACVYVMLYECSSVCVS